MFFFRSWRRRHAYHGDLLNFHHALPPDIRIRIPLPRGDPRMWGLPFGGQKFGNNRGKCVRLYA